MIQSHVSSLVLVPGAPSLFKDLDVLPDAHLPVALPPMLLADSRCEQGEDEGIGHYFSCMYVQHLNGEWAFVDTYYTFAEVEAFIVGTVNGEMEESDPSLPWVAGFLYGWLSALALTDRTLALRGFNLFFQVLRSHALQSGLNLASCSVQKRGF